MTDPDPIVFVVDDDASVRDAIKRLIASVGLRVETFGSAHEFLNHTRPEAPGCLVLDVRLPDLGGLEFQRALAEANIHIPIIFITGHADVPMTVRAMKAGAVEFLTKPFRGQELLGAIQEAIAKDRLAWRERARAHEGVALSLRLPDSPGEGSVGIGCFRASQQADRRRTGNE